MSSTSSFHRRIDSDQSFQSNDSARSSTSQRSNSVSSSIYSNDDYASNIKPFKRVRFDEDPVTGSFFDFDSEDEKPSLLRRTYRKAPILSIATSTPTPKASLPAQAQAQTSEGESPNTAANNKLRSLMSLRLSRSSLFLKAAHDERTSISDSDLVTRAAQTARNRRVIGPISRPIYSSNWGDGLSPGEMI